MEVFVTELHRQKAHDIITQGKGLMMHPIDIAELVARLIAENELLEHGKALQQLRVTHG
jgi:hypothetical protein